MLMNVKDTQGEKHRQIKLTKLTALTKSTNMDIWVVGTSNQLSTRFLY